MGSTRIGAFPGGTARAARQGMDRPELETRSAAFATNVFALCQAVRPCPGGRNPADQLVDAAPSVGANYRATSRARSRKEFVAKIGVVAEEADETVYWLEFLLSTELGDRATVEGLLSEAKELRAIFAASYKTARHGRGQINRSPDRPDQ